MKIVETIRLLDRGRVATSSAWRKERAALQAAVRAVDWPPESGAFTIYPESGKKRGEGNGVKPIKSGLMVKLAARGWTLEAKAKTLRGATLGGFDAAFETSMGAFAVEWETGNISSSHRSLNKMALLLSQGALAAGCLVIPSRQLYRFLTDRIGNVSELEPYFPLWQSVPCKEGVLEIIVIEHDATSVSVPRIPKGTDGRARG